jgi:hypothetical protein
MWLAPVGDGVKISDVLRGRGMASRTVCCRELKSLTQGFLDRCVCSASACSDHDACHLSHNFGSVGSFATSRSCARELCP